MPSASTTEFSWEQADCSDDKGFICQRSLVNVISQEIYDIAPESRKEHEQENFLAEFGEGCTSAEDVEDYCILLRQESINTLIGVMKHQSLLLNHAERLNMKIACGMTKSIVSHTMTK